MVVRGELRLRGMSLKSMLLVKFVQPNSRSQRRGTFAVDDANVRSDHSEVNGHQVAEALLDSGRSCDKGSKAVELSKNCKSPSVMVRGGLQPDWSDKVKNDVEAVWPTFASEASGETKSAGSTTRFVCGKFETGSKESCEDPAKNMGCCSVEKVVKRGMMTASELSQCVEMLPSCQAVDGVKTVQETGLGRIATGDPRYTLKEELSPPGVPALVGWSSMYAYTVLSVCWKTLGLDGVVDNHADGPKGSKPTGHWGVALAEVGPSEKGCDVKNKLTRLGNEEKQKTSVGTRCTSCEQREQVQEDEAVLSQATKQPSGQAAE